jgi:hypothetical protein
VAYQRERWLSQGSFNSTFASSSGSDLSTRNQTDLNILRLLRWNNWFYAGSTSFLQSSVQEIDLQTTLGGGVGRYIKQSNRASIYVLGGFAWQNTAYKQHTADQDALNTAVRFVATQIKVFKFKKTIWISLPRFSLRYQSLDVFISIPTQPIILGSPAICHGTFHSMEAGTVGPLRHCAAATMARAQESVGPSANR